MYKSCPLPPQIKTLQAPYFILSYLFWSLLFSDMTKPSGCCVPVTRISTDPAPAPHPFSSVLLPLVLVPRTWPPRISYGGKVVSVCPLKSKLLSFPLFLPFLWPIDDQKKKREKKKRKEIKKLFVNKANCEPCLLCRDSVLPWELILLLLPWVPEPQLLKYDYSLMKFVSKNRLHDIYGTHIYVFNISLIF